MSLYETFKDIYVGELTEQETRELAKFASALVKAKAEQDVEKTAALVKHAASEVTEYEDFEALSHLFMGIKNNTPGLEKFAGADNVQRNIDIALKGGLLATTLAPLFMGMYGKFQQGRKHDAVFKQVLSENPDLAKSHTYEDTKRNFDTLKQFSPDVASNALVSGNVLQRMNRLGPALMDINMVKELAGTQKDISDRLSKSRISFDPEQVNTASREFYQATKRPSALETLESQTKGYEAVVANRKAKAAFNAGNK